MAVVRPKHRGGVESLLYLLTAAEMSCFGDFSSHLLTNPVRYLRLSVQNGILSARQSKSSVIS